MTMKAIAFNGSARKDGNTAIMARWVFDELEKGDVENDEEAQGTMRTLGQNMAWLLKQIEK